MASEKDQFHIEPVSPAGLGDVALFLHRWRATENGAAKLPPHAREAAADIERRLQWLVSDDVVHRALPSRDPDRAKRNRDRAGRRR